jgi:tRNA A-37 threonylcarbamoyl transferase component Bud32
MTLRTGTLLAKRYRLRGRLGRGGMGEVYEAVHVEIPRRFAVKVLRAEYASDAQMLERFRREAKAAATLNSDHIVQVLDFGHADDGSPYLAMELLEGTDLRRLLQQRGRLSVPDAIDVVLQASAGAAVAHEQSIIHRDLKPENLFLAQRGQRCTVKVLDFGIAKLRVQGGTTASGRLLGTPAYMSPEQVRSPGDIDARTDIYALGVILYELLTGQLPHPGEEPLEIITHLLFSEAKPVRSWNEAVPEELAEVVHRALRPARAERFQSVAELQDALRAVSSSTAVSLASAPAESSLLQTTLPAHDSDVAVSGVGASHAEPALAGQALAVARGRLGRVAVAALLVTGVCAAAFVQSEPDAPRADVRSLPEVAPAPTRAAPTALVPPFFGPRPASLLPEASSLLQVARTLPAADPPLVSARPRASRPRHGAQGAHAAQAAGGRVVLTPPAPTPATLPEVSAPVAAPTLPESEPAAATLEVRRGAQTIVFRRDNPLRR